MKATFYKWDSYLSNMSEARAFPQFVLGEDKDGNFVANHSSYGLKNISPVLLVPRSVFRGINKAFNSGKGVHITGVKYWSKDKFWIEFEEVEPTVVYKKELFVAVDYRFFYETYRHWVLPNGRDYKQKEKISMEEFTPSNLKEFLSDLHKKEEEAKAMGYKEIHDEWVWEYSFRVLGGDQIKVDDDNKIVYNLTISRPRRDLLSWPTKTKTEPNYDDEGCHGLYKAFGTWE